MRSRSVAGAKPSVGRCSAPGWAAGFTRYGVTMITSSLSPRWKSFDLNSAPITGSSPMTGQRVGVVGAGLLQQAGDREALAAAELDRGLGPPHRQRRNGHVAPLPIGTLTAPLVESWLTSGRTRRFSRRRRQHGRDHRQADAELLELDGDRGAAVAGAAGDRDRELAAGEEAGGLARLRRQVRLGEDGDELIGRQRVDDAVDVGVPAM